MKFSTSDLVVRIDAHLKQKEAEAIANAEKLEQENVEAEKLWLTDHAEAFRVLASRINYHLKRNEAITSDMIPNAAKDRFRSSSLYTFVPKSKASKDINIERLKTLRNMLEASEEVAVTPTGLKSLGFSDVSFLFDSKVVS